MIMPGTPYKPPNIVIEKMTQKPLKPVDPPRIFGPQEIAVKLLYKEYHY
jgi:hypothetical protein